MLVCHHGWGKFMRTLVCVSVVALTLSRLCAVAAAQNLPDLGQAPAVVSLAPACAVNGRKEPPDATVQRSCSEQDAVVAQVNGLVQAFSRLTNDVTALKVTSPKAGEIAKSQGQEYRDRANAVNAIHGKLEEIIEVQALMASQLLTGRSLQTASQSLAALQLELLNLKTQSAMPASVSPSPASGTAANSGTISGRIVEDTTGAGVPGAVAIARCGDNGQDEYTTRTHGNGYYVCGDIAHGSAATPCLVRGAKFGSPEENEEARKANEEVRKANKIARREKRAQEPEKAPPRSFETRTIKNLSIPAGGGAATAADLRLPARTAGV